MNICLISVLRYADHFFMQDEDGNTRLFRNLYKAIGVHFLVEVRGRAGQFHFVNLMFNVGSGMALLGIVRKFVCPEI